MGRPPSVTITNKFSLQISMSLKSLSAGSLTDVVSASTDSCGFNFRVNENFSFYILIKTTLKKKKQHQQILLIQTEA